MKVSELNKVMENAIEDQIKAIIKEEWEGMASESNNKKEVYHVKCDGEPVCTCKSQEEAESHLEKFKKDHPGKQFIIEKTSYDSHEDMIDKLDEMGEQLEEKENQNMENQETMEGNAFTAALLKAKQNGDDTFEVDGQTHNVDECWKSLEEEEGQCEECMGGDVTEMLETCHECGGALNEEGMCNECGAGISMYESKKKTLRLTETELVNLISKMVAESVPGISVTKKAQDDSKKENDANAKDVEKKMKDYLSFDGNDNPEFPKAIGKGETMAINNTEEEDEFVEDFKGKGLENLKYDHEPSSQFKERLKKSLEGDKKMGNSQDAANVIKTDTGKKMAKIADRIEKEEEKMPMYKKDPAPTKEVNESKVTFSNILNEEIEKMKKLTGYNKKTQ